MAELNVRGFDADLATSAAGEPLAHVRNPAVPVLSDSVFCSRESSEDGEGLVLFWSWGALIGPAHHTRTAADDITRVLRR